MPAYWMGVSINSRAVQHLFARLSPARARHGRAPREAPDLSLSPPQVSASSQSEGLPTPSV